ncbi:hypothetical protein ABT120_58565 [Nonomuraea angiospora]|uniref:hypothetical protein n=1 Tax=Nonomuraea angiospora TaxID=46172 RepID=UPI0033340639
MGVLVGYFTADSDESARRALSSGPAYAKLPYVDCKGWIDELSDLAAELSGRDTSQLFVVRMKAWPEVSKERFEPPDHG